MSASVAKAEPSCVRWTRIFRSGRGTPSANKSSGFQSSLGRRLRKVTPSRSGPPSRAGFRRRACWCGLEGPRVLGAGQLRVIGLHDRICAQVMANRSNLDPAGTRCLILGVAICPPPLPSRTSRHLARLSAFYIEKTEP